MAVDLDLGRFLPDGGGRRGQSLGVPVDEHQDSRSLGGQLVGHRLAIPLAAPVRMTVASRKSRACSPMAALQMRLGPGAGVALGGKVQSRNHADRAVVDGASSQAVAATETASLTRRRPRRPRTDQSRRSQPAAQKTVPAHGIPNPNGPFGNLHAHPHILVPTRLTSAERDLFERLATTSNFNPRTPTAPGQ